MRFSELLTGAVLVAGGVAAFRKVREYENRSLPRIGTRQVSGPPKYRIVIVGGGFAGLAAASHLDELVRNDPDFDVLMIDRHNYHLFYPLLYQVSTGGIEPGNLAFPLRVVARHHGFRFLQANVEGIDVEARRVDTASGAIPYDCLILAPGSVSNFFGMKDAAEHAMPLKSLEDGVRLRNRIVETFELAEKESDPERRKALLTYVLVGGGATGVELASSLCDMIYTALLPNYPGINPSDVRLVMVESHRTVLNGWTAPVQETALKTLRMRGVHLVLGTAVTQVTDDWVEMKDGTRIPSATVVWTAGIKAPTLIERLPAPRERDGRVRVNDHLELPEHPGVFVVGDAAFYLNPVDGKPVPPTAEAALSEGHAAAEYAVRRLRQQPMETYQFHSKGELVSLGRGAAAANIYGVVLSGLPAWILRRAVYLVNLVGFRNRVLVFIDWVFVSFHRRVIFTFDGETASQLTFRPSVSNADQAPAEPAHGAKATVGASDPASGAESTAIAPPSTASGASSAEGKPAQKPAPNRPKGRGRRVA